MRGRFILTSMFPIVTISVTPPTRALTSTRGREKGSPRNRLAFLQVLAMRSHSGFRQDESVKVEDERRNLLGRGIFQEVSPERLFRSAADPTDRNRGCGSNSRS